MSSRTAFRSLASQTRCFASSSRLTLPTPADPSSPIPSTSTPNFGAISRIFDSSFLGGAASRPSAHTPDRAAAVRGYAPESIPPKIDPLLDLFTNLLMVHGKKAEAQRRVTDILGMIQRTANTSPQPLLARAVALSSPAIRVSSTRKRAKVVQTPVALNERQRARQSIMWLLKAAERGRKGGLPRDQRIAREVFAVLEGQSDVFKWLEERHKVATANRSNLNTR